MTKMERVDAVLAGRNPDRPPVTFWYHFGTHFGPGITYAEHCLQFFDHYDIDILKVMNDYHFPCPHGLDVVKNPDDLEKIDYIDPETSLAKEQLKAIEVINSRIAGKAYFIDTVFDPWQQLVRHVTGERTIELANTYPDQLLKALDRVTDYVIRYGKNTMRRGAAGIFLAIQASDNALPEGGQELFSKFIEPQALRIMEELRPLGRLNILHICGTNIYRDNLTKYAFPVLNWADRLPGNPSIDEMKKVHTGVMMGGIDHTMINRYSWESVKENVREAIQQGGTERFILSPGCSCPSEIEPSIYTRMVALAKRGAS